MAKRNPFLCPEIDLALLPALNAVSYAKSFAGAARSLGAPRASVHRRIKELEAQLGTALYRCHGHTIELTDAGRELATFARQIVHQTRFAVGAARGRNGGVRARLVVDAFACAFLLGPALRSFVEGGHGPVDVVTCEGYEAIEAVRAEEAEVAVVAELGVDVQGLEGVRFTRVPTVVVAPQGHWLLERPAIRLGDLASETRIVWRGRQATIERALADAGVAAARTMVVDTLEVLVCLVSCGFGIGIVEGATRVPDALRARPIVDLPETAYRVAHTRLTRTDGTSWALREAIVAEGSAWRRTRDAACSRR